MKFILLNHPKEKAKEREIDIKLIESVILNPEQIVAEHKGLKTSQNKF